MTDHAELGPKMLACSERERRFVWAFLEGGGKDATKAAREAGVPDPGPHSASIRVAAHHLRYRPRVIAAMQEVAERYFQGLMVEAVGVVASELRSGKRASKLATALTVLSRLGLGEKNQHAVTVEHRVDTREIEALARRLAVESGVPVARLLGPNVIEGEVVDERISDGDAFSRRTSVVLGEGSERAGDVRREVAGRSGVQAADERMGEDR